MGGTGHGSWLRLMFEKVWFWSVHTCRERTDTQYKRKKFSETQTTTLSYGVTWAKTWHVKFQRHNVVKVTQYQYECIHTGILFAWETVVKKLFMTCSHVAAFSRGQSWYLSTHWNSASQVGEEAHGVKLTSQWLQGTWGTWVSCQPNDRVVQSLTASQGVCLSGTHFPARTQCSTACPKLLWLTLGSIQQPVVTSFSTF